MPNSRRVPKEEENAMRYEKMSLLLDLALEMRARRYGMSLKEIEDRFGVAHRTAQRMRAALEWRFPQMEEVESDGPEKRWRIPPSNFDGLIAFTPDELAAIDLAVRVLQRDNRTSEAASLAALAAKLRSSLKPAAAERFEIDLEIMLEAEGLAMRPGPRPRICVDVVERLRHAIKAGQVVRITHRNRRRREVKERLVHPYGFLHGHRNYLVGWPEGSEPGKMVLFSLPDIEAVALADKAFERDPEFRLHEFAAQSFGVFHAEPFDTVWRFSPEAAETAAEFVFHPSQEMERGEDGSLTVRFRAAGDLEMAWHLYTWGDNVEVLEPPALASLVNGNRPRWPGMP